MTDSQWVTLIIALVVHTAALFRWGGRIDQMLKDHDRRIGRLEGAEES